MCWLVGSLRFFFFGQVGSLLLDSESSVMVVIVILRMFLVKKGLDLFVVLFLFMGFWAFSNRNSLTEKSIGPIRLSFIFEKNILTKKELQLL